MRAKHSDIEHQDPGDAIRPGHGSAPIDDTDYEHRHFINLLAIVFLLVIAGAIIWTVRAMDENEHLQRCLNAGRRDCVKIDTPPSMGIRMPTR